MLELGGVTKMHGMVCYFFLQLWQRECEIYGVNHLKTCLVSRVVYKISKFVMKSIEALANMSKSD